jgi:acetyl-CoA carboxylase biotin carboxyl carrier protein
VSSADDRPPALLSSEDVQDILRLLDGLPFGEFTLETGRFTVRLTRTADGGWAQETQVGAEPVAGPAGEPPAAAVPPRPPGGDLHEIRAPLPGTFYRAPEPGAPPYVETGSQVGTDTVVALIETMKLMNPVYAGTAGTVSEICLADGQFADPGAVLMRVAAQAAQPPPAAQPPTAG